MTDMLIAAVCCGAGAIAGGWALEWVTRKLKDRKDAR